MAYHNDFGAQGEDIAIDYLRSKGYVILDRNWRSGHKEIDIVARKDDIVVFVEVRLVPMLFTVNQRMLSPAGRCICWCLPRMPICAIIPLT